MAALKLDRQSEGWCLVARATGVAPNAKTSDVQPFPKAGWGCGRLGVAAIGMEMTPTLTRIVYIAHATVTGGRAGHGRTSDGALEVDFRPPTGMGGEGGGTNPEQLFAVGYVACFQSVLLRSVQPMRSTAFSTHRRRSG